MDAPKNVPNLDVALIDLSQPMLDRATGRIKQAATRPITTLRGDIRGLEFSDEVFDIILAAAVLHRLRVYQECTERGWRISDERNEIGLQ